MSSCTCDFHVVLMVSAQEIRFQIDAIPGVMLEITQNALRAEGNHSITILRILMFGFVHEIQIGVHFFSLKSLSSTFSS